MRTDSYFRICLLRNFYSIRWWRYAWVWALLPQISKTNQTTICYSRFNPYLAKYFNPCSDFRKQYFNPQYFNPPPTPYRKLANQLHPPANILVSTIAVFPLKLSWSGPVFTPKRSNKVPQSTPCSPWNSLGAFRFLLQNDQIKFTKCSLFFVHER